MDKSKELLKNTIIIAVGKICTQFISFLLLPVYTSLLTTSEYGLVDLLSTLISILIPLVALQLEQAVFRYLIDSRDDEARKIAIISSSLTFVLIMITVYSIIFLLLSGFIHNEYKYFLLFNVIISILSNLFLEMARGLGKNHYYALGGMISAISILGLNIIFVVVIRTGAYGILISNFLGNFLCVVFLFIALKLYRYVRIYMANLYRVKSLLKYSLPLVPNSLSWWIINSSDRTIITFLLGIAQNGIYSAANKFSAVYISLYNIFNITWTESVSLHINDRDGDVFFMDILDKCIRLFAALSLGIVSVMPFAFHLLINEKFSEAYYQIPLLMLASFVNVLIGLISTLYIAKKLTKEVAKTSAMAAVINIVVNLLLIKKIGLYAASVSTLVAYGSMLVYRMVSIYRLFKVKLDMRLLAAIFGGYILVFFAYYSLNTVVQIINLLFITLFCIYLNRSSFSGIAKIIFVKLRKQIHEW